ncbi:hypothetical protein [Microcoleus sp. FACHB-672]|uniref:hypothetical protein n=1 Tax=Microcoleus sp. FACHB-672 TaxID=2692825 RepID=UPI001689EF8C|nr:hypothetical protein [Microcoleus sp. FACHB-672]MBD2041317.1 hypothetical protein [Microcoleus sp. FACHB-672]
MQTPTPVNESALSTHKAKSIFASKTFWGVVFTTVAAIAPILGNAVKEQKLTVDATVNIVIILCGSGATVAGRVQATQPIYTPQGLPGPNIDSMPS